MYLMDEKIIKSAFTQLENNANSDLILPIRKKLWLELGEIRKHNSKASITEGLCKRVKLAGLCVEKVLYLWENTLPNNKSIQNLLDYVDKYLNGRISFAELEKYKNMCSSEFEEIAYIAEFEKISLIGLATVYVADIALYDELLFENSDDDDNDDDLDSFTWDTSYLISLVYSDNENEDESIKKKYDFWSWYLKCILI